MPAEKPRGKIIKIKELTSYGLTVELDNGVSVSINFNENEIYMNFGGFDYERGIHVREASLVGRPLKLANYVTVQYQPNPLK